MNYIRIKDPPRNESHYETVDNTSGNLDEMGDFPARLMDRLRQGKPLIKTGHVPIGWATDAIEFSHSNDYEVRMLGCDDPSDPGGTMSGTGVFYFQRKPKKNAK